MLNDDSVSDNAAGQTREDVATDLEAVTTETDVNEQLLTGVPTLMLDTSPFTDENLWQLGDEVNWNNLRRILSPLTDGDFAVTDVMTRLLVDGVRKRFDSSVSSKRHDVILQLMWSGEKFEEQDDVLRLLLSVGLNPDLADANGLRASHICGFHGALSLARTCFSCRPDMGAKNNYSQTPLQSALLTYNMDDPKHPDWAALRPFVAKFIREITGGGTEKGFPSIAELSCKRMWFAVKNLIRRRVVPLDEFSRPFSGKTVDEWADFYKFLPMKEEILYYKGLLVSGDLPEAEQKIVQLRDKVDSLQSKVKDLRVVEDENVSLRAALERKEKEMLELKQLFAWRVTSFTKKPTK